VSNDPELDEALDEAEIHFFDCAGEELDNQFYRNLFRQAFIKTFLKYSKGHHGQDIEDIEDEEELPTGRHDHWKYDADRETYRRNRKK